MSSITKSSTIMAKKTLAQQIADLDKPQNDFDIEDSELADPFADEDAQEAASEEDDFSTEHYVAMPKSKLRQENDTLVSGKKYTGSVTSRKDLYGDALVGSDGDSEDDNEQDEDEDEEDGDDQEEDAEEESDSGISLDAVSDSEDQSEDENMSEDESDHDAEDAEAKRSRIRDMISKERKHIISRLSDSGTQDAIKGYAIVNQHKMSDALIDSRLKIQKALTNSNLLPVNSQTVEAEKLLTKSSAKYLKKATTKCYDLLDTILDLRSKLYTKEQIVTEPFQHKPEKRSLAQYLETTKKYDNVLNQYRSTVLTRWLAKIQNSSGSTALNASKFKALNQSAEQQVVNNLSDMDRLVKRTKLNRRQVTPLGYEYYQATFLHENKVEEEDEDDDIDIPKAAGQSRGLNMQEMALIFDDEDFYRVLLNDLVDKKIQSNDPTSGLQFALRGAASTKLKKNVDNKASKGRKLRYHVQESIANFETPRNELKWDDGQIDEFFASLLGQKVNMREDDDEKDDDSGVSDAEDDLVLGGDDSIKLFG